MKNTYIAASALLLTMVIASCTSSRRTLYSQVESEALVEAQKNNTRGDIIPDFSRVGYHWGDDQIPTVPVVMTLQAPADGADATGLLQGAIDKVSALPLSERGAILLSRGQYNISDTLYIKASGIVLRGQGNNEDPDQGTVLYASDTTHKYNLIVIGEESTLTPTSIERMNIKDDYVPVGQFWVRVDNIEEFKVRDQVVVYYDHNDKWISDLKMDQIKVRPGASGKTKQWNAAGYKIKGRREITKISGDTLWMENPIVYGIDKVYGGGAISKYEYGDPIVSEVGVEDLFLKSNYTSDECEMHGWIGVRFMLAEHSWVRNVDSKYFDKLAFVTPLGKNISVLNCNYSEAKSKIVGGRRYPYVIEGELSLVKDCTSADARHCYNASPRNLGPNVFTNCHSIRTHADIGPHHRWNSGTLYDNITTTGMIHIQDRGYMGSGHGWAGVTQVLWNCEAADLVCQSPWVAGDNYQIGVIATKGKEFLPGRPQAIEVSAGEHVFPLSLYDAQLALRHREQSNVFDVD